MEKSDAIRAQAGAGACHPILTLGGRVSRATTLTVLVAAAVGSGLFLGWDSLAALGLTGVIVSLLPCLVMCAAGVCASRMDGKNAVPGAAVAPPIEAESPPSALRANAVEAAQELRHEPRPPARSA